MQQNSRVMKSLKNAKISLVFYFLTLVLSFFSRKIFLDTLGADFVGLTTTLQNLLGFLNLAELGISTAIGYVLYKPLFEHDEGKINEIISVFGYLYRWIGLIILGAGIILSCFLPLIFPDSGFNLGLIYFAYSAFLISSLIGYFINYRQTLLGADQKNYVVTAYFQTINIVKTIIQMVLAYYTENYYLWVILELSFGIIYSFILNRKINRTYPWLKSEIRLGKQMFAKYPEVIKYTKQLFVHQIASFVQFQTTPFLTYAFVSLQMVAFYGNYMIIVTKVNSLLLNFWGSIGASIGNLVSEGNTHKNVSVFWELISIRYLVGGICAYAIFSLLSPFITLWLGEQYLLSDDILVLVVLNFFIGVTHQVIKQFLYAYGLFSDTWAPIAEACIFIIVALIGGSFWGLAGILLGGIVSQLIILCVWKPYFLFTKGFNLPIYKYWSNWIKLITTTIISFLITYHLVNQIFDSGFACENWIHLILYAICSNAIFCVIQFTLLFALIEGMRNFVKRIFK